MSFTIKAVRAYLVESEGDGGDYFQQNRGHWLIDSIQETDLPASQPEPVSLTDLEWMVGHWVDKSDQARVDTVCRWSGQQSFLVRSFKIKANEENEPEQGTEIIGWDPKTNQIRSWMFLSDGSFGEAVWTKDGDDWERAVPLLAAGKRYGKRIAEAARGDGSRLIAHAYTRYLGDLSGGQIIRKRIAKSYEFPKNGDGVRFYVFREGKDEPEAGPSEMKALKEWFKAGMDVGVGDAFSHRTLAGVHRDEDHERDEEGPQRDGRWAVGGGCRFLGCQEFGAVRDRLTPAWSEANFRVIAAVGGIH